MCGIFCLFYNRPLVDKDISSGRMGTSSLAHRGPDATGEWIDAQAGVFIGHRRLSIIDPSPASAQPLKRDGMVVAFNGEIYNFHSLRDRLTSNGSQFESAGDTEVLLRSWQNWGIQTLEYLDGMFSFVIWDGKTACMAVDPFGEKPLYWATTGDGILVSSELSPLTQILNEKLILSGEILTAYLSLGYIPAPSTAFSNIYRLPAGTTLTVRKGNTSGYQGYWAPPVGEPGRGPVKPLSDKELDRIESMLTASLRDRIYADVPVCLFLSSGVDSALVAALLKRVLGIDIACITVGFPRGKVINEAPHAQDIAGFLGCSHNVIESDEDPQRAGIGAVLDLFGEPNDNITILSVLQMAQIASSRFKVALTGMGGDEVFWGYGKHAFFYRRRHVYRIPEFLRLILGTWARHLTGLNRRFEQFAALFGIHDSELYLAHKNYPTIDWLRGLPGFSSWAKASFGFFSNNTELAVPAFELAQVMQNSHLRALDLGSMRASLELRSPFLNRGLVEMLADFDPRAFIAFGQKSVLRRLLARHLPSELVNRPKRGFIFPQDQFLQGVANEAPMIPGLPSELTQLAWGRRNENSGWQRLAVRLVLANKFTQLHGNGPHSPTGK